MFLRGARATGTAVTGSVVPAAGRIREEETISGLSDSVEIRAGYEGLAPSKHEVGVYVDGVLVGKSPAPATSSNRLRAAAANLGLGSHSLYLEPALTGAAAVTRHGDRLGRRSWLKWPASTDAKTAAYRVLWDAGDGGAVNRVATTLDRVSVVGKTRARPTTGTGHGRATVSGSYSASVVINKLLEVAVTAVASTELSIALRPEGGGTALWTGTAGRGETVSLPYGIRVTFHSDLGAYAAGDTWAVLVGPANEWLTPTLDVGTYKFAVVAVTKAGNVSTPLATRRVTVVAVPDAVSAVTMSWDPDAKTVSVGWNETGSPDEVRVYTNWDPVCGRWLPFVNEERPIASVSGGVGTWTFDASAVPDGELRFYLRPVSTSGLMRPDTVLYRFNFPPTPKDLGIVLGAPVNIQAAAAANGRVLVTWDYRLKDNDNLARFQVWAGGIVDELDLYGEVARANCVGRPVLRGSLLLDVDYVTALTDPVYVQVLAVADDAAETTVAGDVVSVSPESDGPAFGGELVALAQ